MQQFFARQPRTVRQFVKFGITGGIGATVDFGIYTLLTRVIGWRVIYLLFGYEIIAANMLSVFLAILSNFIFNKFWTFRDARTNVVVGQGFGYIILNTFTWALNQIITSFFIFRVPLFTTLFGESRDFVAKAAAIGFILFINFFGSKFLIFRSSPTTTRHAFRRTR